MKKQQNEEKKSAAKKDKGQRIWKITAIAVVVIFLLIVTGVLIKIYHYKSSFEKPSQAQIDEATKIAAKMLQSTGSTPSTFQIHAGSRIKRFYDNGVSRSIIQVSFINNSTSHIYLIDVNSGEVLLHSETDTYGAFANHQMYERHGAWHTSMEYPMFPEHKKMK